MRIGDAAAAVGTTPRALRFYEQRGLLPPPPRTGSGQRHYGPDELALLRVIRDLLAHGLTVEDVRALADRLPLLAADPPERCAPAPPYSPVPTTKAALVVRRRLAALDAEIERLTRIRDSLLASCGVDDRPLPPAEGAVPEPGSEPPRRRPFPSD
ncbi:MerR family transcriptional regulator [Streptomyces sp. NPDC048290]|uniref:MerR family transcriptional regulator n=1 Tax=Streptomyces sp. NPDC048290 TaxID=3155811 RepID=UPI00342AD8C7